ncbi:Protein of unknown function [Pyronema omphalodes CBS 100304]|uniref:Uncharacterized protein n=1 Tax=Pyronema omphalodes (strain CBS 100304) TaxID=1076935 RepID=U4LTA3_PYROM|nr:Protein of unknown function [Pyronema omphalodes CBS 100304]
MVLGLSSGSDSLTGGPGSPQ